MKLARILAVLLLFAAITGASQADAGGLFSRWRTKSNRSVTPSQRYVPASSSRTYPTRNLNQGRTRLPSGRSYYQGRYYGNFNNRFYGPQYGYF